MHVCINNLQVGIFVHSFFDLLAYPLSLSLSCSTLLDVICVVACICGEIIVRKPQDGATALMLSAKFGHAKCLRQLLEKGADKEAKDKVHLA